jgi:Icc-related predicted phosphoesterase
MKILAFVDLHGSLSRLEGILNKARKADLLVCAGDLSLFERNIEYLVYKLDRIGKPVLIIPGNHESEEILRLLCRHHKNIVWLEKRHYIVADHLFVGCAGNGFARIDAEFARAAGKLEQTIRDSRKKLKDKLKYILVLHAAPYNTRLDKMYGAHHGNRTVRGFIERTRPELVICGHFHENAGKKDKIGKSIVMNPGPHGELLTI